MRSLKWTTNMKSLKKTIIVESPSLNSNFRAKKITRLHTCSSVRQFTMMKINLTPVLRLTFLRFFPGNYETLFLEPIERELQESQLKIPRKDWPKLLQKIVFPKILQFHSIWYSSNVMCLTVLGRGMLRFHSSRKFHIYVLPRIIIIYGIVLQKIWTI